MLYHETCAIRLNALSRNYFQAPHSRRDTDSLNDETFGSTEYTSEDRAEQERRRRGIDLF